MERTDNQKKRYTSPSLQVVEFKVEKGFADSQQAPAIPTTIIFSDNEHMMETYNTESNGQTNYFEW